MSDFELLTYPRSRRATFDVGKIGASKHHVIGLLEIDVTLAKQKLKEAVSAGKKVGFTSWLLKVVGNTVSDNKHCHAINHQAETQIAFHEVDIAVPIEREVNGVKVPLVTIVRKTNQKSIEAIHSELQNASQVPIANENDYVLAKNRRKNLTGLFFYLPQWARMIVWVLANAGKPLYLNSRSWHLSSHDAIDQAGEVAIECGFGIIFQIFKAVVF